LSRERLSTKALRVATAFTVSFAVVSELDDPPPTNRKPYCSYLKINDPFDDEEVLRQVAPIFWVPDGDPQLNKESQYYAFQVVHPDDENMIVTITLLFKDDLGNKKQYQLGNLNFDPLKLIARIPFNFKLDNDSHKADAETVKFYLSKQDERWVIGEYGINRHNEFYLRDRSELNCDFINGQSQPSFVLERGKHGIHDGLDSCNSRSKIFGIVISACSKDKMTTIEPDNSVNVGVFGEMVNVFTQQPLSEVFPAEDSTKKRFCGGYSVSNPEKCIGKFEWEK